MVEMNKLPAYMNILGNKIYHNPVVSSIMDDDRIVTCLSLGAHKQIIKDLLSDITKNSHVLQIGLTFGPEINAVYEKVFKKGKFDIFDVSEEQIQLAKKRYQHSNINIYNYNADIPWDEKYDVIICYNLLHEIPLKTRQKVMDNVLNGLTNGGKAVFVDCAEPIKWNPIKWPLFLFNRLFWPFAESIWFSPIENFCSCKNDFRWKRVYYSGKRYQKVVAVRKILSSEDVIKLTKIFRGK